jgi:hypothetical protein
MRQNLIEDVDISDAQHCTPPEELAYKSTSNAKQGIHTSCDDALSDANTCLRACGSWLAEQFVSIAITISSLANVGVAQSTLAPNMRAISGPHQGGEEGADCELELHFVGRTRSIEVIG